MHGDIGDFYNQFKNFLFLIRTFVRGQRLFLDVTIASDVE